MVGWVEAQDHFGRSDPALTHGPRSLAYRGFALQPQLRWGYTIRGV